MHGPDPDTTYPMPGFPQICFLKNIITRPNIEIGDFTYYDWEEWIGRHLDQIRGGDIAALEHACESAS
jgi:virginiamycin A acetyltransferase